jgi:hypothetical protein
MIVEQKSTVGLVNTGVLRTQRLGITSEGLSHIATILQDTLYTDKILAPIREYSTNASDAHVEAGTPLRPILIKLPNRFQPTFAVRDFGPGMDEDRIWNVFCNYGESTKRCTNGQVGMLGIGSKSAFAYGKSFTIVSFLNGTRRTYACHIGGSTQGDFVEMAVEPTTEENGLEIQIPVSVNDIQSFIDRSAKFFAHWEVTPEFTGATMDIAKAEKLFEGDGWYMAKDDPNGYATKGAKVLMGNISYAVGNINTMKPADYDIDDNEAYVYRKLLESNLILKTDIGTVDIAANRESLQMTDKTIKTLWSILKKVRLGIGAELQKKFDVLPTMWEKRMLRHSFSSYQSPLSNFGSFLPQHISSMATSYRISDDCGFETMTFSKGRRGKRQVRGNAYQPYSIEANEKTCVIINRDPLLVGNHARNRVVALIERIDNVFKKNFTIVYIFNIKDEAKFTAWKDGQTFDFPEVSLGSLPSFKFSEIYPHLRKPSTRSVNSDKNSKKFLLLDLGCTTGENSDYFKAGTVPKKPLNRIPYIVIDRYQVIMKDSVMDPYDVISYLKAAAAEFKVKLPDTIVAVKKGSVERLEDNANYISLWEAVAIQLKSNKEFFDRMVTLELRSQFTSLTSDGNRHIQIGDVSIDNRVFSTFDGKFGNFDKTKLFHKILVSHSAMKKSVTLDKSAKVTENNGVINTIRTAVKSFDDKVTSTAKKTSSEFIELLKGFYKNYPMVKLVDSYSFGYSSRPEAVQQIGIYINLVDSSTK